MVKRAVLIGVNDYQDDSVPDLHGCLNDVELIADVLTGRYGFDPANITRLVNAPDNTRQGIFDALDRLIDETQSDDAAVIFYSGHGSQTPDTSGEEDDQYDETIVPSDSGRGSVPVRDIIDDELNSYVTALAQRTPNATFIFDSCHSGSVDREVLALSERVETPAVRAIPPAERAPEGAPHLRPEGATEAGVESAAGILQTGEYVLIAGCQDSQTSKETDFDGRRNGALTYFLAQALQGDQLSLQSAYDQAANGVQGEVEDQDPVLEAPQARRDASPF
jgi:hypothetical protein